MFSIFILATAIMSLVSASPVKLVERAACSDVTVVFARGTTETGALGSLVGPSFQSALKSAISPATLDMMGVTAPAYPASVADFLAGGSAAGSKAMASMIQSAMAACPNTKMVISGYSQGGQLVHNAAKDLPESITSKSVAVIFGDPDNGTAVAGVLAGDTLIICHSGDNICQHGDMILEPHLTYGMLNSEQAADFVKAKSGLGIN